MLGFQLMLLSLEMMVLSQEMMVVSQGMLEASDEALLEEGDRGRCNFEVYVWSLCTPLLPICHEVNSLLHMLPQL